MEHTVKKLKIDQEDKWISIFKTTHFYDLLVKVDPVTGSKMVRLCTSIDKYLSEIIKRRVRQL